MSVQIVVGAQWGDEGKGKIVDLLSEHCDIVARYQGGANAGHTVEIGDAHYVLHQIPSGIFHPQVICVIGNGVVIDPVALVNEIRAIESVGISIKGRLKISHKAHLIMPYHKALDSLREQGTTKIGTTGRGIGPAYIDKAMRVGIRIVDLLDRASFAESLRHNIEEKNVLLRKVYDSEELDVEQIISEYLEFDKQIDEYITDTTLYLHQAITDGKNILCEGAQGALLDLDHGTYPFVTSSNPTSGGACTGLGIPPTSIDTTLGVAKAYCTRVGNGPFPTEQMNDIGERLRNNGGEYGATTGRPRRCGWYDAVAMRYSAIINGISRLAITKLDVLSGFDEIFLCTEYTLGGKTLKSFPSDNRSLLALTPCYEKFEGWKTDISTIRSYEQLPLQARTYLDAVAQLTHVPIEYVSVGPKRHQTIKVA